MLGAIFAILSAASFALNNATVRRGVVSGTPIQAMAVSVPLGMVCFLPLAFLTGELFRLPQFPRAAVAWMAGLGVLHFVIGRYCNFRANSVAGVNLTAPVVQLQVVVTMVLAVIVLHEPCTALQMIGGVLILAGSLITQRAPARTAVADEKKPDVPLFAPRYLAGYLFASLAAVAYGTTPIMARFALEHTGPSTGILGGLIAYVAATAVAALALFSAQIRRNVFCAQPRQRPLVCVVRRVRRGGAGLLLRGGVGCAGHAGDAAAATVAGVPDAVLDLAQSRPRGRRAAGARGRRGFGSGRADGVDRHQPDRQYAGDPGAARPRAAVAGVSYLPLST